MIEPGFLPFSLRFRDSILKKKIQISLSNRMRKRTWKLIKEHDVAYGVQRNPNDSWTDNTTVCSEVRTKLLTFYGDDQLYALNDKREPVAVNTIEEFMVGCYPSQVFDVIELIYRYLDENSEAGAYPGQQEYFQRSVNAIFRNEKSPWLLCEGFIFSIDSQFLEEYVVCRAHDLLSTNQFQGALNEFAEARKDMEAGDHKDVVLNSFKALESVLKVITKKPNSTWDGLVTELQTTGFYAGLPTPIVPKLWEKILHPLCLIRNKVSAHGQGEEMIAVPETLARFCLNLSGSTVVFLIEHYLEINKEINKNPEKTTSEFDITDDDFPF